MESVVSQTPGALPNICALPYPEASRVLNRLRHQSRPSMSIAEHPERKIYLLDEIVSMFITGDHLAKFGLSDKLGFQKNFIEMQLWDQSSLKPPVRSYSNASIIGPNHADSRSVSLSRRRFALSSN